MKEMLRNIIDDAELQGAEVNIISDNEVSVIYGNGKIDTFTEVDGILTTERKLTTSTGLKYYSETRKDVSLSKFGSNKPRDLIAEFETNAHFYGKDGKEISDIESLEKYWQEIKSMSEEDVQKLYFRNKDTIRELIDESIITIRLKEEKDKENDKEELDSKTIDVDRDDI